MPLVQTRGAGGTSALALTGDSIIPITDQHGHAVSGASPDSLSHFEQASHELRCFIGDPVATVDRALAASLEMTMARVLKAWPHLLGTEPDGLPVARDCAAKASRLPEWSPGMPGYHAVLGMHAFGLEESADYQQAERQGRKCVELEPRDGWGRHAVAHVLEMRNRPRNGIDWLAPNSATWSSVLIDMIDASAMLWRLQMRGVDIGDRWNAVADNWAPIGGAGNFAFNDLHAMMAFVGSGRRDAQQQVLDAQQAAMAAAGDNAAFVRYRSRWSTSAWRCGPRVR